MCARAADSGRFGLKYGKASMQGRRTAMEDTYCIQMQFLEQGEPASFFAIYDGHGGKTVATYCAHFLHHHVREAFHATRDMERALIEGIEKTDQELESKFSRYFVHECGSTVVAAVVDEKNIYIAHVGDARGILVSDGAPISLTSDHKPDHPDEKKRIENMGGVVSIVSGIARVGGRLAMSRAVGDHGFKEDGMIATPEINHVVRQFHDEFLLLACDGIFESDITNENAAEIVKDALAKNQSHPKSAQMAAEELVKQAYASGSEDNLSAIVVLLDETY